MAATGRRVLVIEDEPDLRALLTYNIQAWGYEVRAVEGGKAGLRAYESFAPDLVLLDLMLPDMPGMEVCKTIRAKHPRPRPIIVMLTARGDEIDRVAGFEVGADDYVVKPFSVRELMLRMNARLEERVVEEGQPAESTRRYVLGPLQVDPTGYHVYVEGHEVHVSALEMRLLVDLFESQGLVRSRKDLLRDVWGYQPDVTSRTVDAHVKRLRDKLGVAGALIETVRGVGYRLAAHPVGERAPT